MIRTCQKCSHIHPTATGDELEACPQCGAIYSRVTAAMAAKAGPATTTGAADFQSSRSSPSFTHRAAAARDQEDVNRFAEGMRQASLYPTFRGLVRVIYFVWMVLAALSFAGGVMALVSGSGTARIGGFIGGMFFALFFAVIAKVTKEAALMLADLSDAAVHIAARMKP